MWRVACGKGGQSPPACGVLRVACGKGNGRFMNLHRPQGGDATNALVWRGQQASEVRVGFGGSGVRPSF